MVQTEHHDYDGITENREQRPPVYFTVLFYGLIIWGVAFCAFYLLSGWSSNTEFQVKMQAHEAEHQGSMTVPTAKPAEPPPAPPKSPEPVAAPAAVAATPAGTAPDAKALFETHCTGCHGAGGKGGFGPDLTAKDLEYGKTRQALFMSVAQGRGNGKMPAFEGQLKREEIYALADHILTLK